MKEIITGIVIKSKALKVLKQLNKEEFHKLEKFFSSPYFNTNKRLVKLYKFLKKFYPAFDSPKFTRAYVFRQVYENEEYNDEKLRKLFSDVYKELERFLVIQQLERDREAYNKLLLRMLDIKKLDNLFLLEYDKANEFLDNREFWYGYYLEKFLLQWHYISFHLDRGKQQKIARNILDRGDYSTLFYLSDFFLTINDIRINSSTFGADFAPNLSETFQDNFDFESFFKHLDEVDILHKEIVRICYYAYEAYKNFNDEKYYYELENYIFLNLEKLSKLGQINALSYLITYCNRKTNRGNENFRYNLNEIYRIFLKHGLFVREEEGYVRSDVFLKILDNYFHVGKIEEFGLELQKNINYLNPEHRANILSYYRALLNFNSKNYDKALSELIQIKTNSLLFNNRIKILSLKSYYELQLFDEAEPFLNNFKRYLVKNKSISELVKAQLVDFLSTYSELLKIKLHSSKYYLLPGLSNKINGISAGTERKWLCEKINELKSEIDSMKSS